MERLLWGATRLWMDRSMYNYWEQVIYYSFLTMEKKIRAQPGLVCGQLMTDRQLDRSNLISLLDYDAIEEEALRPLAVFTDSPS